MIKLRNHIFLIDATGALITALLLSQVLTRLEEFFGIPVPMLWILASVAFVFAAYSLSCQLFVKDKSRPFLSIIMVANLLYCTATIGIMLTHTHVITAWGYAYFIGEIMVILGLVYVEFKILSV